MVCVLYTEHEIRDDETTEFLYTMTEINGVFSTREKAKAFAQENAKTPLAWRDRETESFTTGYGYRKFIIEDFKMDEGIY